MARAITVVRRPHDCHSELKSDFGPVPARDLWYGSTVQCSCGKKFELANDQRDGTYWKPIGED